MNPVIEFVSVSDVGRERSSNQDRFLAGEISSREVVKLRDSLCPYIFAVADGMGGHAAGERAAALAIDTLLKFLEAKETAIVNRTLEATSILSSAFHECHRTLAIASQREADCFGMGTTLTAALVVGHQLSFAHAGDSRLYILRGETIEQLTTDHTLGSLMQQATPHVDDQTPFGHILWNALKADHESVEVDTDIIELLSGDTLLLCSDGLTRHVSDDNIELVLESYKSLDPACHTLVDIANAAGGSDNITIVAARCDSQRSSTARHNFGSVHRISRDSLEVAIGLPDPSGTLVFDG